MEIREAQLYPGERITISMPESSVILFAGLDNFGCIKLSYICEPHLTLTVRYFAVFFSTYGSTSYTLSRAMGFISSVPSHDHSGVYHIFEEVT
jgi:hypothetical protein